MYTNDRNAYRQAFFIAWQKHLKKLPLEAVEAQLIEVMLLHPEYHVILENPQAYQYQEFAIEDNPFFHLSLHISIREQIRTDRPKGIAAIYQQLSAHYHQPLESEHLMMACLANMINKGQETGEMPSETEYLQALRLLA